jgi:hypothetical protein
MSRSVRVAAAMLALSLLAGCPEGPRMDQWTPERDPHPPAVMTSADARRAAEKEEDEGLAAALAAASAAKPSDTFGEGGLGLGGIGEGAGKAEPGGLIGVGRFGTYGGTGASRPKLRLGRPDANGRLPPEVIQRIVRQKLGVLRACYLKAAEKDVYLEGKVTVSFVITREGSVDKSQSKATTEGDAAPLGACVKDAITELSFPQPEGGIVKTSFWVTFSPGDVDGTVNDKNVRDVTLDDVKQALTSAGWSKLESAPRGDSGIQVIKATKGDETIEVTFVPFEEKRARLTEEEWAELDASATLVHHYLGFGLAVKAKDRAAAKAALSALIRPAPAPKGR